MAYLGANAAWHMGQWEEMATYVGALESEEGPELSTGSFLSAVLNVRHGNLRRPPEVSGASAGLLFQALHAAFAKA